MAKTEFMNFGHAKTVESVINPETETSYACKSDHWQFLFAVCTLFREKNIPEEPSNDNSAAKISETESVCCRPFQKRHV